MVLEEWSNTIVELYPKLVPSPGNIEEAALAIALWVCIRASA
jgi:hypothetical protein